MLTPSPTGVKRKVHHSGPTRRPREREHLPPKEVERVIDAAHKVRWGLRDATLLLMLFSHGLRLAEALRLGWKHINLDQGVLHLRRLKNGLDGDHRLRGVEIRALRRMRRLNPHPHSLPALLAATTWPSAAPTSASSSPTSDIVK